MLNGARRRVAASLVISAAALAIVAAPVLAGGTKWVRTPIGDATSFAPSAISTSDGVVHVAWFSISRVGPFSTGLSISSGSGKKWKTTRISTNDDAYPSISYDSTGHFHVAASVASGSGGLVYLTNATGAVTESTITTDPQAGAAHIAVGPSGRVQVLETLSSSPGPSLAVAVLGPTGWTTTSLPATNVLNTTMAVDRAGATHVAWSTLDPNTGSPTGIDYATDASGAWVAEPISTGPFGYPAIAIDSNGGVHVVAIDQGATAGLDEFVRAAGSWTSVQLAAGQFSDTQFRIDAGGHQDIAFLSSAATQTVRYLTNASGAFMGTTVETGSPESPSLAITPGGSPYIAFHEPGGAIPTGVYVSHH